MNLFTIDYNKWYNKRIEIKVKEVIKLDNYEHECEKSREISKKIREHQAKPIYPTSFYLDALHEVTEELNKSISFLKEADENPVLFFTQAKEVWGSHRNILYRCLDYQGRQNKKRTVHEFQAYVGSRLDEVFQLWKKENGVENDATIEVRNGNTFPSIYGIYLNGQEMMQFNIFEKTYGMRFKVKPEEKILQAGQREEVRLKADEKKEKARLEDLLKFREKPFRKLLSFRVFFHLIFKKSETTRRLNELIRQHEENLQSIQERIQYNRERLPFILQYNQIRKDTFSCIEPFFVQFHYQLEENQAKLY